MKTPNVWLLFVGALACGIISSLGFAPIGIWPLTIIGIGAFCLVTRPLTVAKSALAGYLFGLGFFGVTISYVAVLGTWVAVLLVAVVSCYLLLVGVGIFLVQRLPFWPLWVACLWTSMEFCLSRFPLGGFGWSRLAFTSPDSPFGGYLWLLGAPGVTFLIALAAALLADCVAASSVKRWLTAVLVLVIGVGGWLVDLAPVPAGTSEIRVGIVQGNVDGSAGPRAMGYAMSVTNNHLAETITLLAKARTGLTENPDIIVWPENSVDLDPTQDAATARVVSLASHLASRPLFIGAVMSGPGAEERQTSSLWYDASGELQARYDKRNAVPFGEYTPFKKLVFALVPMAKWVGKQTVPGTKPGVLSVEVNNHPIKVGDIICYELAFDKTVYDVARYGAQIVLVQSNNATYTATFQPKQQFAITRVRAMELRREIVVTTTSSFSGLIAPKGEIRAITDEGSAACEVFTIPQRQAITPAVQTGPIIEIIALIAGLISAGLVVAKLIRRRGRIANHE